APPALLVYPLALHDALPIFVFQNNFAGRVVVSGFSLGLQACWVLWVLLHYHPPRSQGGGRGMLLLASGLVVILSTMFARSGAARSEEHTSELQSRENLVCRL